MPGNVDLSSDGAAQDKMRKNAGKYPADKCRGSAAKYSAYAAKGAVEAPLAAAEVPPDAAGAPPAAVEALTAVGAPPAVVDAAGSGLSKPGPPLYPILKDGSSRDS